MSFGGDVLGYWGRNIVEDYHDVLLKNFPFFVAQIHARDEEVPQSLKPSRGNLRAGRPLPQLPRLPTEGHDMGKNGVDKVGILGAGVGGLYTALILDSSSRWTSSMKYWRRQTALVAASSPTNSRMVKNMITTCVPHSMPLRDARDVIY